MRILLISPPMFHTAVAFMPKIMNRSAVYPPLGMLYVAAALRKNPDWEIRVVDAFDFRESGREIGAVVESWKPDVAGLSAITWSIQDAYEVAEAIKQTRPETHVTFGGYHNYLYRDETIALDVVDTVVTGEAEESFPELVGRIERGESVDGIPGVSHKEDGEVKTSAPPPWREDLDGLPHPARDLLPADRNYAFSVDPDVRSTTMLMSRGCPYSCIYCCNGIRYYNQRSPESVVEEMVRCRADGYRWINFVDENFNMRLEPVKQLCDRIVEAGLDVAWSFRARVDRFDEELAEKLVRAGCVRVNFGVEAGTDRVLRSIRKGTTIEQGRRAFALTRKYGLRTVAYFLIGLPGETDAEIRETFRFALEVRPDFLQFNIPMIFPRTQMHEMAVESGQIDPDYFPSVARDPGRSLTIPLWLGDRTEKQILALQSEGYRRFYLRPSYFWARIREIRSLGELWRKVRMGLNLFYYALTGKRA